MKFRWLMGTLILVSLGILIACSSSNINSSTTIADLIFTSQGDMSVESDQVNLSTGLLTMVGSEITTGANTMPVAIKFTPDGKSAFVINKGILPSGTDSIATYTVNGDGSLSSSGSNVASGGPNPVGMAIDPNGKFLFVANEGTGGISGTSSVSVYAISGATVTQVPGCPGGVVNPPIAPCPTDDFASAVAVSPIADFVYVTNTIGVTPIFQGEVTQYSFDSTTGALSKVGSYFTGTTPAGVAITPKGDFLYTSNFGSNNISGFTVASDGTLGATSGSPYSLGSGIGPKAIITDPIENFLYVADYTSNQVSGFKISAASGALSPLTPNAVSTGFGPTDLAMDSTGIYLYTTNIASATISGFHVNSTTGALGPLANPFSVPGQPSAIALH